jgi:GNAT superfamily N-acetyltransferase
MTHEIAADDRLVEDGDAYWTVLQQLPERQQDEIQTMLEEEHLQYWEHPTDRPERTRTALGYDDRLTVLVGHEDAGIVGYDTSFPVTDDRLEDMYSRHIADTLSPVTGETDAMLVYHMVIHPAYRGNGYGRKTAFLRQQLLEQDWAADVEDTPEAYYQKIQSAEPSDTFTEQVQQIDTADYASPDAVISFPRLYETEQARKNGERSRAYRISQGFGFDDCGFLLNGQNDTFIIRTDPVHVHDRPVLLKEELSQTATDT